MSTPHRRTTIYLEADLHRALKMKAAETDSSLSDLVNQAVRQSLLEDADDLAAFRERAAEPTFSFEDMLKDLRRRGRI